MKYFLIILVAIFFLNCQNQSQSMTNETPFGQLANGQEANLYTLKNKNGITVKITNYGGIITQIITPDKDGRFEDIVLGHDSLAGYLEASPYFGAIIGRYGNRIAKGKFSIGDKNYNLVTNNGPNHLHGGSLGFDKVIWDVEPSKEPNTLVLSYVSRDGEEGYPGNLKTTVKYTLIESNTLEIDYQATTDKTTPVNLTNHTYFNLSGDAKRDILDAQIYLYASRFLPVDAGLIPTGELKNSEGTPFHFLVPKLIKTDIGLPNEQLKLGGGYDHCYIFDEHAPEEIVATIFDKTSGRLVECRTTEPAVQLYTGNFLDGSIKGKKGVVYGKNHGLCLETQHYPDSPNQPAFPNTLLKPGETYHTKTSYSFLVARKS
jgi:aldose 1-epimerase